MTAELWLVWLLAPMLWTFVGYWLAETRHARFMKDGWDRVMHDVLQSGDARVSADTLAAAFGLRAYGETSPLRWLTRRTRRTP